MTLHNQREMWFALQVWSQHENSVTRILTQKGIETLSPTKRIWRRWRDRTQASDIPLFPGYVFARFDPEQKLPVVITPRVQGIVGFGKKPAPIDEQDIEAIRKVITSGLDVESGPALTVGDRVEIVSGPLTGVFGILTERRSSLRLVISVQLIHRSVSVEVTADMLAPMTPQPVSINYLHI